MKTYERCSERILRIPFLMALRDYGQLTTSFIIDLLREQFSPNGKDAELMANRKDDYFSQKVRNTKSHGKLGDYVEYINKKSGWKIKDSGLEFLSSHSEEVNEISSILGNDSFSYEQKISLIDEIILPFIPRRLTKNSSLKTKKAKKSKKVIFYDEDVQEGKITTKTTTVRERSKKLREAAIEHFSNDDGTIKCSICGFEFSKVYGDYGKGYIEIHHIKPVYQYDEEDVDAIIGNAINNLIPVCSNCHRMLHHKKNTSIDEIKSLVDKNIK